MTQNRKRRKKTETDAERGRRITTVLMADLIKTGAELLKTGRTPAMIRTAVCPAENQRKRPGA